jgi:hypothetical protein
MNIHTLPLPANQVNTRDRDRAVARGADELMDRCEYALENQPEALHSARKIYRTACVGLYAALERHYRQRAGANGRAIRGGIHAATMHKKALPRQR